MFSELVGAVTYLHDQNIVHRDIKLESKLLAQPHTIKPPQPGLTIPRRPRQPPPIRPLPVNRLGRLPLSRHYPHRPRPVAPRRRRREARNPLRLRRLRRPRGHHGPALRRPRYRRLVARRLAVCAPGGPPAV
jgi:serine/threonine protein kinase